jgi:phosphoesterase RecJ-like protein
MTLSHDATAALDLLAQARVIRCVCHKNPDGDALGSLLGLVHLLEQHLPLAMVTAHCVDAIPTSFQYLPGVGRVQRELQLTAGDVVVMLDCADAKLTGLVQTHPQLFDGTVATLNVDHHYLNPRFGRLNLIIEASSTCEILTKLADHWQWSLSPDVATCLLTGVLTDTGGLLHSNTSADVYRTVSQLLRAGASHQQVITSVFRTAQVSTLRLWGRVLEKITLTDDGGAVSAVTQGDFRATGADPSELSGAIDYVNAVPGMRFSLVLSERDGLVKGSLRTLRDDVDVSAMAAQYQGGGHRKAAGFSVTGKLQPEVRWKVVEPSGTSTDVIPAAA